jgi:hypothetical protein
MGRSKEKQAREEAEAIARKDKKKDSGDAVSEAVDVVQDASVLAKDKKRSKRSKELAKEDDLGNQQESPDTTPDAAAASEADIEGIERRRAREEAKCEKEEKKGWLWIKRINSIAISSIEFMFMIISLTEPINFQCARA